MTPTNPNPKPTLPNLADVLDRFAAWFGVGHESGTCFLSSDPTGTVRVARRERWTGIVQFYSGNEKVGVWVAYHRSSWGNFKKEAI